MLELSYSKIRAYLNCPWLYKLKFIEEWKAPPSPEASLGISIHKTLEKFHGKNNSRPNLADCLDDVWERAGYKDSGQELEFYDKARRILDTYEKEIASRWSAQVLEVEKSFELDLPDLSVKLKGTIDRLDQWSPGGYALVEYKTHAAPWDSKRLKEDLQMTLYSYAMGQVLAAPLVKLFFLFVSQGKRVEVSRSQRDWEEALSIIGKVAVSIEAGRFSPDTSYCHQCEMNQTCSYSVVHQRGVERKIW